MLSFVFEKEFIDCYLNYVIVWVFEKKKGGVGLFIFYSLFSRWQPFSFKFPRTVGFPLFKDSKMKETCWARELNMFTIVRSVDIFA